MPGLQALLDAFMADPRTETLQRYGNQKISVHVAMVLQRGKIIAWATNGYGTRSRGAGYSERSIHAERNVIKELGDISKLRDAEMVVMRITGDHFSCSKPCAECQVFLDKCIREYGLRRVYYTA